MNFYAGYCMIVDHNTSKLRGIGECRNGLYYLMNDEMKTIVEALTHPTYHTGLNAEQTSENITHGWVHTKKQSDMIFWHLRLGHTPFPKLSSMGLNIKPNPNPTVQPTCVSCPMANSLNSLFLIAKLTQPILLSSFTKTHEGPIESKLEGSADSFLLWWMITREQPG